MHLPNAYIRRIIPGMARDKKVTMSVRVEVEVIAALEKVAQREGRATSNMGGHALKEWCQARGLVPADEPVTIGGAK